MSFTVISVVLFCVTLVGLLAFLGLWTYEDAKVRSDKPVLWTLLVLLTSNFMGLIIYLLVGRNKNTEKSTGKYKKPLITFAILFIITMGLLIGSLASLSAGGNFISSRVIYGTRASIGRSESYWNNQWSVSFRSSGPGYIKTVNLSSRDLDVFNVTGNCESGKLYLRISQGEISKTIDISDFFSENVDMSQFQPGSVRLLLLSDDAKDARAVISWR